MTAPAIRVEAVNKSFRIPLDHSTTLKYRATHPRSSSRYRPLLALQDVSFDVPAGEFLGITGPNGCGKSTLLKILSRIYEPDSGRVQIAGRVSPFLELGVGFNPELTARENIFLGGAVLGLTRRELEGRVDAILAFAELTDFADQKIKNFSSGMAVRLAFTVAIQAEADILLMDEVLAVGDARFQEKCFDVFADYKRQGRTVVLVSHDLGALNLYCDRVLLLQRGQLIADGAASAVTAQYRRIVAGMSDNVAPEPVRGDPGSESRWGTREVEVSAVRLLDAHDQGHTTFATGEQMTVAIDYRINADVTTFAVRLAFKRSDGADLSGPSTRDAEYRVVSGPPGSTGTIMFRMAELELLNARYLLSVSVYDEHLVHAYDHIEDAVSFRVVDARGRAGMVDLRGSWSQPVSEPSRRPEISEASASPTVG
ncbi:MAG: ABC transporter ATP-binding protein [Candidatus Dormibacteraeota bacterium]|uniref:ABC transporter ATP-binding protein n=1 Tax=Candidatus Amunia macphersoniae TaxID=3127014 RepID=A0A934KQ18_9BACT|nr:ABC transporter ATP-binding protein [Candidatus Dormibacteraeota bacterium]